MFAYLAVEPNGNELIFSELPCRIDEYSTCSWFSNSDSSQCGSVPRGTIKKITEKTNGQTNLLNLSGTISK